MGRLPEGNGIVSAKPPLRVAMVGHAFMGAAHSQDGEWRIWKFRCYEIARAPIDKDWISFAAANQENHDSHLAWFGDDGVPVFLPDVDEPLATHYLPYGNDRAQTLDPAPPLPYREFDDTFR